MPPQTYARLSAPAIPAKDPIIRLRILATEPIRKTALGLQSSRSIGTAPLTPTHARPPRDHPATHQNRPATPAHHGLHPR